MKRSCVTGKAIRKLSWQLSNKEWYTQDTVSKKQKLSFINSGRPLLSYDATTLGQADTLLGCTVWCSVPSALPTRFAWVPMERYMCPQQKLQVIFAGKLRFFNTFYPGKKPKNHLWYTEPSCKQLPLFSIKIISFPCYFSCLGHTDSYFLECFHILL